MSETAVRVGALWDTGAAGLERPTEDERTAPHK